MKSNTRTLSAIFLLAAALQAGELKPPRVFRAGSYPFGIAAGDFNEDGRLDLAVANSNLLGQHSSSVGVFLGNGDGTLQPMISFTVGKTPRSVVVADFNHDGHADLAVANQDGFVSILLGDGHGHFQPARNFSAGPSPLPKPGLTIEMILDWADDHHAATGVWPTQNSGQVHGVPGQTWVAVNVALARGNRGLPGKSSLAALLAQARGTLNKRRQPNLTVELVLKWAEAHYALHGKWPTRRSGPVTGKPHETWIKVDGALVEGLRGLPGGSSVAKLLFSHRNIKYRNQGRELTEELILKLADAFYSLHGRWPSARLGDTADPLGETWSAIDAALDRGNRGLPGGTSLAKLLADDRGMFNVKGRPKLTEEAILAWANEYRSANGVWPTKKSGPIPGQEFEKWSSVDSALFEGLRGLPGKSSLKKLLEERGKSF